MLRYKPFLFLVLFMILVSLACGPSASEQIENIAAEATQPPEASVPTATIEKAKAEPTATAKPTDPPAPTATTAPAIETIKIDELVSVVQNDQSLAVVFFVENPNLGHAIEEARYQVDVYDASGTMIESDWGYISLVMPGQKLGMVAELYLEENQTADRVEVTVSEGDANPLEFEGELFSVEQPMFIADDWYPRVTGVIKNGLDRDITDLRVTAIAYNEAGDVVGGGYTYVNFLPASGQTGVEISCPVIEKPVKVEIYPTLSSFSAFEEDDSSIAKLALVKQGYVLEESYLSVAFLVKNTNQEMAIDSSQYQVVVYDDAGGVLATDEGYIEVVFPNEFAAGFSQISIPEGKKLGEVVVQLNAGETIIGDLEKTPFVIDQTHFWPGDYSSDFTAQITNPLDLTFTNLKTVMVAYDAEDNIIGGGYAYLDFIPAGGKAGVSMSAAVSAKPARLEFYPMLSSLSDVDTGEVAPLVLKAQGYAVDDWSVGVAFLVENTDAGKGVSYGEYQILIYGSDGSLIDAEEGYLPLLLPGQTSAEFTNIYLPDGTSADQVEIQLHTGDLDIPTIDTFPLSVGEITYQADSYSPKATALVKSAHTAELTYLTVIAVAYDDQGNIIGGGSGYVDALAAGGEAVVEISLTISAKPAKIEVYPVLSSWSDLD